MRRRCRCRAKLWAGVYVGLFGIPDDDSDDRTDAPASTDDTATEGGDDDRC